MKLVITRVNRVAQICRDPEAIARNAESIRRHASEYIDDGSMRSVERIPMKPTPKPIRRARDARTGRFVPLATARRRPATTVVETVKRRKRPRAC